LKDEKETSFLFDSIRSILLHKQHTIQFLFVV